MSVSIRRIALTGLVSALTLTTLAACTPEDPPATEPTGTSTTAGTTSAATSEPSTEFVRMTTEDFPAQIGDFEYQEVMGGHTYNNGTLRLDISEHPPYDSFDYWSGDDGVEPVPGIRCKTSSSGIVVCGAYAPDRRVIQCLDLGDHTYDEVAPACKQITDALPPMQA